MPLFPFLAKPIVAALLVAAAPMQAAAQRPQKQSPEPLRRYELQIPGLWGADLAPAGNAVAVLRQRTDTNDETGRHERFLDVEVWDFRSNQRVARHTLAHRLMLSPISADWGIVRYTGDGKTLLVYDGELLDVLQADTLREITRIDLGLPPFPRVVEVVDVAAPHSGDGLAAVWVARGYGLGGTVRVFDLSSGALARSWSFDRGYPEFGGHVAWLGDGKSLAVTLLPTRPGQRVPPDATTLEVLDAATGNVLREFNTGDLAGPVSTVGRNELLTSAVDMAGTAGAESAPLKLWDATTGRMIRKIETWPNGARGSLAASSDGKRAAAYTGLEMGTRSAQDPHESIPVAEQRFQVWDIASGNVVAASPRIYPNIQQRPDLRMSADGSQLLLSWRYARAPVLIYEIPAAPAPKP